MVVIIACALAALRERTMTVYPAFAATSARPEPMIPEPQIPTFEIFVSDMADTVTTTPQN
jgi:hypothetical protein